MAEDEVHRVQFIGNISDDTTINITTKGNSQIFAHIGFLKVLHKYRIEFDIPDILGEHVVIPPMQNIYIKVSHIVYNAAKKCYTIGAELAVIKEGLFREHFIIYKGEKISRSDNVSKLLDNEYLTVIIKAQIMGKGRGTPSLKDGVHKIGVIESDNDSDSSDWKGFD